MQATTIKVSDYLEQNPGLAESTFDRLDLEAGDIGKMYFTVFSVDLSDGESDTERAVTLGLLSKTNPKFGPLVILGAAIKSPHDDENEEVGTRLAFVRAARQLRLFGGN